MENCMGKGLKDKIKYYGIILLVLAALVGLTMLSSNQQKRSAERDGGYDLQLWMDAYNEKGYVPDHRRKEE